MDNKPIMGRPIFCSFSTSLSDLTVKQKRDPTQVFDVLVANGGFSCFEIDNHLAKPVDMLFASGYLRNTDKASYPWCTVEATERGRAWRYGQIVQCQNCKGEGFVQGKHLGGRNFMAETCQPCNGEGYVPTSPKED